MGSAMRYCSYTGAISMVILMAVSTCYSASIAGRVTDKLAGIPLAGAIVVIDRAPLATVSDRDGNYRLSGIPAGSHTVTVTYIGYQSASAAASLAAEHVTILDFALETGVIIADEILVIGQRLQGQARAINQQRANTHITNIVAADQIGRFPDANVGDAMKRVPGIVVDYDQGEPRFGMIRGTEARMNSVMLNGERLPSAEGEIRAVQLDLIPADMVQAVEVNKTLTPDMDADAIGGSVNLVTRSAPEGLRLSGTLGSGYNFLSGKPLGISSLVAGDRYLDGRLGLLVSASYHNHHLGSHNIEPEWGEEDGLAFVEEMQIRDYDIRRIRRSVSGSVDFELDDRNALSLRSIWNQRDDFENRYRLKIKDLGVPAGGQTQSWEVVRDVKGGSSANDGGRLEDQRASSTTLGGFHQLGGDVEVRWTATYSKASEEKPDERHIEYVVERDADDGDVGIGVRADLSDPEKPMFTFLEPGEVAVGEFELNELNQEHQLTEETDRNGRIDIEIPWLSSPHSNRVVVGFRYRGKEKMRDNRFFEYSPLDEETIASLAAIPTKDVTDSDFLAGDYEAGFFPSDQFLGDLDLTDPAQFEEEDKPDEYVPANYDATETVSGGYVMLEQDYGTDWSFILGARLEVTNIDYTGSELYIDPDADEEFRITPVASEESYTHMLPGVHARYQFDSTTVLRFAWTNTLARPNYYDLVPYREIIIEDAEVAEGNPTLDPTTSMNFDVVGERYFESVGLISAGVFAKSIDDFIFFFLEEDYLDPVTGQTFDQYVQPRNGKGASLRGVELALYRQLDFVPALRPVGVYTNYTYTDSEIDELPIEGRENDMLPLPGTAKHSFNGSLSYENSRVSGRLSVNYTGSHIDAGAGEFSDEPFTDRYFDSATHVDLNGSVRLTGQVRLFLELNNLTNQPLRLYQGIEERTLQSEYYDRRFSLGLKFDL